ncbi:MAG: hypothetical protein M1825_006114 [Sarcosagium campestre]|nr:MAG: hypothetical protein M1825_006114 [Sarcosagium campestre]
MANPHHSHSFHSTRNHFREPPSLWVRLRPNIPLRAVSTLEQMFRIGQRTASRRPFLRRIITLPHVLIVSWLFLLLWGERSVFTASVQLCDWDWEDWPESSTPHHLVLVADPQLVDPHTYPGRPWPLSALTTHYADRYLHRSYATIERYLRPSTILFLGDLFDGGREWNTGYSASSEPQWKRYGEEFWLREYDRFGRIFFGHSSEDDYTADGRPGGRKVIASLPGNHDLGFSTGVQLSVRDRFGAYFGDGNRVDVIGNHTFVSIDSVSLSAQGQPDPEPVAGGSTTSESIWRPTQDFLDGVQAEKRRAVSHELQHLSGYRHEGEFIHKVLDTNDRLAREEPKAAKGEDGEDSKFPTILLTHVPLYRQPGVPCGPLREHWPPSSPAKGSTDQVDNDARNAIPIARGYQYQNVLTPEVSAEVVKKVGNVAHVFSGDDHDYCEVLHKGYTTSVSGSSGGGGIREITVKSISFAMGVRKPGFLMVSLWNPVSESGGPGQPGDAKRPTIQTRLCLLPDQLSIFVKYGYMMIFTLAILTARAVFFSTTTRDRSPPSSSSSSSSMTTTTTSNILPISKSRSSSPPPPAYHDITPADSSSAISSHAQQAAHHAVHGSSSSTTSNTSGIGGANVGGAGGGGGGGGLAARAVNASSRARSASPGAGYAFPSAVVDMPSDFATPSAAGLGIDFGIPRSSSPPDASSSSFNAVGPMSEKSRWGAGGGKYNHHHHHHHHHQRLRQSRWPAVRQVVRDVKAALVRVTIVVSVVYFWLVLH